MKTVYVYHIINLESTLTVWLKPKSVFEAWSFSEVFLNSRMIVGR